MGGPEFSSDGSVFAVVGGPGSEPSKMKLYDSKSWNQIAEFELPRNANGKVNAHPSRPEMLVASGFDGAYKVSLTSRKVIATIPGHYTSAQYSPDGQFIALGASHLSPPGQYHGMARVIRSDNQAEVVHVTGFPSFVNVAWRPDGKVIAATSANKLKVFDLTGRELFNFDAPFGDKYNGFNGSPVWNHDGTVLAVAVIGSTQQTFDQGKDQLLLFDTQTWTLSLKADTSGWGAYSPVFTRDDKIVGAGMYLFRSPEGITQATLNASADVRMGQQFRDQWLARIEPLCQSGQLIVSACYKARAAIEEGRVSEYPDLQAFLLNEISLDEFLQRFNR